MTGPNVSGPLWCGICGSYVEHDTVHHDAAGGLKVGDIATLGEVEDFDLKRFVGMSGRIDAVRGRDATVAFPGKTGTNTVAVPLQALTLKA